MCKLKILSAFIADSQVVLMDEPTKNLTINEKIFIWDLIKKYSNNKILIITSNDWDECLYLSTYVTILANGG